MCTFFSLVSDGEQVYYFDSVIRKKIIKNKLKYDSTDSHTSIADYYKLKEDKLNKYEYDVFAKKLTVDQINTKDDRKRVKVICNRLDFKTIVPELIIKPVINPFNVDKKKVTKKDVELLKQWDQVCDQVWAQVRDQVWAQVGAQVGNQVRDQVRAQVKNFVYPHFDGEFYSYYTAWHMFMRSIGVNIKTSTDIIDDQLQFGFVYPLEKFCIISDRISDIRRNARGLHRDGGPALSYLDGTKIWSLNGVRVPQWLAETKRDKMDCREFAKIRNAEVRREFLRKVGVETLCQSLGSVVIHKQGDYELHEIDLGGDTGKWPYLKMLNPSIGVWHMECVDRGCRTVEQALIWRNQSDLPAVVLT